MRRSVFLAVVAAATLSACATRSTPDTGTFEESGLLVTKLGDHGSPIVFIPGLSSGAWAWEAMGRRYARDHVVYLLTLPGFDGRGPAGQTPLATAEAAVMSLIEQRHIERPVLIGHSLGGTMAIHLAQDHADRLAGVVAVDGLPVFPRSENLTRDQRAAYATRVQGTIPLDPAAYAANQETYMDSPGGVMEPILAKQLAAKSGRSDPASVARYLYDDLVADFRPGLGRITVPVLLVSPYYAPDYTVGGQILAEADKTAYYTGLMRGTPRLEVVSISPARHFVMFEQPDRLAALIDAFLARAKR